MTLRTCAGFKIAFVGVRGIPGGYGGAETFVGEIASGLLQRGFKVIVTCESTGFGQDVYHGITRLHIPAIQGKTLTIPTVNDVLATIYLLCKHPDVRLIYYVAPDGALAAIVPRLLGKKVVINTDGLEWKRPILRRRYLSPFWKGLSYLASWYLKFSEWLAVKIAHTAIADSKAIKHHLDKTYHATNTVYIPYGARKLLDETTAGEDGLLLNTFSLCPWGYYLTVGRIVAENNIHLEIAAFKNTASQRRLVIVGNFDPKDGYCSFLEKLKNNDSRIVFLGTIYDKQKLGTLRKNCLAYIHAYEVGGTNPSLLEQMVFGRPILAYDVPFHREVLQEGGIYFKNEDDLAGQLAALETDTFNLHQLAAFQSRRLAEEYNWDKVTGEYCTLFLRLLR